MCCRQAAPRPSTPRGWQQRPPSTAVGTGVNAVPIHLALGCGVQSLSPVCRNGFRRMWFRKTTPPALSDTCFLPGFTCLIINYKCLCGGGQLTAALPQPGGAAATPQSRNYPGSHSPGVLKKAKTCLLAPFPVLCRLLRPGPRPVPV